MSHADQRAMFPIFSSQKSEYLFVRPVSFHDCLYQLIPAQGIPLIQQIDECGKTNQNLLIESLQKELDLSNTATQGVYYCNKLFEIERYYINTASG